MWQLTDSCKPIDDAMVLMLLPIARVVVRALGYKGDTQVKLLTVTKWLSGSTSDSYECVASYLGLGFESIWGVTMRLAKYAEKPQSQPVLEL